MAPTDAGDEDVPEFEEVFPDLDIAGRLLGAVANDDADAIGELRDVADADWWNVAWTLALLMRGVRDREPTALALVEALMGDDSGEPDSE